MATLKKTDKPHNDLAVIMICLAKLWVSVSPWASEHSFVSVQCLYVMCEGSANYLEYSLFLKLAFIICIVAGDKFTVTALLCNAQYLNIVDSDM
jgi:hypothetical protein